MPKNNYHHIEDILEYIDRILTTTAKLTEKKFCSSIDYQDMILRRLEVIGEATKRLPKNITSKYPLIPWKELSGIRDVIAHDYDGVRMDIVWNVISHKLPKLKVDITHVLNEIKNK